MTSPTVIVPTQTVSDQLDRLLSSLAEQSAEHQVIVVDNASPGGAASGVSRRFPGVEAIRVDRNLGFSRAVNLAAVRADGTAIVLVNDDCVCDPPFVERIVSALDPSSGVVMASGVMRDGGAPSLIDTAGVELDRTLLGFDYLNGEPTSLLDVGVADPLGPSGAAAAFDRSAFLEVGGFDERLFAYWEDVDLALRLVQAGGRCALAPAARGTHAHSATLGSGSTRKNYLMGFGRGYVLRKWSVLNFRRAPGVLLRDAVLCLGQLAVDRNAGGIRGRVAGYRAAAQIPHEQFPARILDGTPGHRSGAIATLRRHAARRSRLRRRGKARPVIAPAIDARPGSAPVRSVAVLHLADHTGPSISLEAELGWLAAEGSLELVTPGPGRVAEAFEGVDRLSELEYSALTLPHGPLAVLATARGLAREVSAFRSHLRASRPELAVIVTAMLPAALIAARREGIPSVLYVGELVTGPSARGGLRGLAGRTLIARSGALADAIIACSDTVARQFEPHRAKVTTIYPPIRDTYADGDGEAYRSRHSVEPGEPLIAAAGSLTEGRGQDVLVRALPEIRRSIPGARCVIAGEPFARPQDLDFSGRLHDLVAELELERAVVFAGFEDRIADLYAAADVVVNPARFPEPFGRVAPEALVARRPVVASSVGAIPEVLRDGETGLLVPPGDPGALAAAVARVLGEPGLAAELARRGRADVLERFSAARGLEQFKSVVAATAPARGPATR